VSVATDGDIPRRKHFKALRMEVNDELGALEQGMRVLTARLEPEPGSRPSLFIPRRSNREEFQSAITAAKWLDRPEWPEPRRNPEYDLRAITPNRSSRAKNERRMNPRSRSAKLRVAEKIG